MTWLVYCLGGHLHQSLPEAFYARHMIVYKKYNVWSLTESYSIFKLWEQKGKDVIQKCT